MSYVECLLKDDINCIRHAEAVLSAEPGASATRYVQTLAYARALTQQSVSFAALVYAGIAYLRRGNVEASVKCLHPSSWILGGACVVQPILDDTHVLADSGAAAQALSTGIPVQSSGAPTMPLSSPVTSSAATQAPASGQASTASATDDAAFVPKAWVQAEHIRRYSSCNFGDNCGFGTATETIATTPSAVSAVLLFNASVALASMFPSAPAVTRTPTSCHSRVRQCMGSLTERARRSAPHWLKIPPSRPNLLEYCYKPICTLNRVCTKASAVDRGVMMLTIRCGRSRHGRSPHTAVSAVDHAVAATVNILHCCIQHRTEGSRVRTATSHSLVVTSEVANCHRSHETIVRESVGHRT
jgi:hypothetical protein